MNKKREIKISKFLSLVLRHKPEVIDLNLGREGWANVEELLAKCAANGKGFTREELDYVVKSNDKKRFAFSDDGTMIRASQGHSLDIDLGYTITEPPKLLYHGTPLKNLGSIKQKGLLKRGRHHVHLSLDKETARKVASRYGKPVILTIRSGQMFNEGHPFYVSANNVWLTDRVPQKYIEFPEV